MVIKMRKPFEGIFGDTAELKILDLLIPLERVAVSVDDIVKELEIENAKAQKVIKKFLEYGILKHSYQKDGVEYYELNTYSPIVQSLNDINNYLILKMLGSEME